MKVKPIYKKVKVLMPHCPNCKEELGGENSLALPYFCKCGTWKSDWMHPGEYEIIPSPKDI